MKPNREQQEQQALPSDATSFMLVRHGETPWNLEHRLQGQQYPGPPLNATGERQAAAVAAHLAQQQVDVVYASDLLRAQQTMQAIMQALPNTVQAGPPLQCLRERALGQAEGLRWDDLPTRCPTALVAIQHGDDASQTATGVEPIPAFEKRAFEALQQLATQHPGQHVVVVTHGGFLSCISSECKRRGLPSCQRGFVNGSVSHVLVQGSHIVPRMWNAVGHLEEGRAAGGGAQGG